SRGALDRSSLRPGPACPVQCAIEAQLMRIAALAALLLLAMGQLAAAEAPVSVAATVDKRGITIGDPIGLTLVVETDSGYQITDTGVGRVIGEFEVLQTQQPQLTRIQNGRTRYTFRYRITAFRVGDLVFPQINVAYQAPDGTVGVAPTAELNRVATLGLPEKGRYAEHYALVGRTLRFYVRDRFGLAATERTPKELREDMLRAGIDRTEIATIYEILRDGDVARFHRSVS